MFSEVECAQSLLGYRYCSSAIFVLHVCLIGLLFVCPLYIPGSLRMVFTVQYYIILANYISFWCFVCNAALFHGHCCFEV